MGSIISLYFLIELLLAMLFLDTFKLHPIGLALAQSVTLSGPGIGRSHFLRLHRLRD